MRAKYHPEARRDFDESFVWYAERSRDAALRLVAVVDAAITSVVEHPTSFAMIDDQHRECSVGRFPFRIVFRELPACVVIIAVAHTSPRPGYWASRALE